MLLCGSITIIARFHFCVGQKIRSGLPLLPQTYIRAYTQTQTHSHPHTHTHKNAHAHTHTNIRTQTHTQTHTQLHTQTDSFVARDVRSSTTANAAADGLSTNKNYYNEQSILIEYTTTTHGSRQSITTRRFG